MVLQHIWDQFLNIAREEVGSRIVETWFKSIALDRWDTLSQTAYLCAPNEFIRDWVEKNYMLLLRVHLGRLLHVEQPKVILFQQGEGADPLHVATPSLRPVSKIIPAQGVSKRNNGRLVTEKNNAILNSNYLFDSFVIAPHNSFAYAACAAVAEKPGILYNPLFIYGKSGVGKTHLLHAIANTIKEHKKKLLVIYQSADRFVQEFFNAIRFDTMHLFQSKYHAADVLLIDDIQYLVHKETTQEAFFQLFNILHDMQKQIVCSGNTLPSAMQGITERLCSRLTSGLIIDMHIPPYEARCAIIHKKATYYGETLPDDVVAVIASQEITSVRDLEGILARLFAFSSLTKQPISFNLTQTMLAQTADIVQEQTPYIDFDRILKCIHRFYKYDLDDLRSKKRTKELVLARQVAMLLMKKMTNKSLRDIGKFLGNRNHATVKHGMLKIEEQMRYNHQFCAHIRHMQQEVTNN
jgi:chromosomal replication initiator protein